MNFTPSQARFCQKLFLIPYYPRENHTDVLEEIAAFADRADALEWLILAASRLKQWPGVGELRGLYCTRFKPADGIEADCTLPGHRPAEIEAENLSRRPATAKLLEAAPPEPDAPTGLLKVKVKTLPMALNYQPPEWLKNL
jgi:hypothetical protein